MKGKSQIRLIACFVVAIVTMLISGAFAQADGENPTLLTCPRSQGYWANHPVEWTVTSIMLGTQFYSQAELLTFLPGGGGDASLMLAVQLAATKLNLAAGADAAPVSAAMLQADAVLAQFTGKLPYNVPPSTPNGQALISLSSFLDQYNNGQLTANCILTPTPIFTPTIGPSPTPSTTPIGLPVTIIIEGPVQVINVNIITIYDIDIEININDPILGQINVGDFVRIEGNLIDNTTTVIVIAVAVYIVDFDIVVGNNNVIIWEDDRGNCNNPPPPWAPAHGWRRRCQGQNPVIVIPNGDDDEGEDDDDDD